MDVLEYLGSKGYHGKRGSGAEYVFPCFFDCGESGASRKRKLYVNTDTGMYWCHVCQAKGGTTLLMRHFGDAPDESTDVQPVSSKRLAILEASAAMAQEYLSNNDKILLYLLNERGLTEQTIIERRLGYVGGSWSLAEPARTAAEASRDDLKSTGLVFRDGAKEGRDFFWNHLMIPYLSRGRVLQMRGRVMGDTRGGRYMTGPGEVVRLYGEDDLDCQDVIITEGEFDAIILAQHLRSAGDESVRKIGVVGLPGVSSLPEGFETMFSKQRRVYIGFDTDEAGRKGAEKVKGLLGAKARIIELPELGDGSEKNDWSYFFTRQAATWRDAVGLLGQASGRRLFSFGEAALARDKDRSATDGINIGFEGFDQAIHPGMRPGQLCIVLAKTGTGKTLFLCNIAYNIRSEPLLFISLEMTKEEVVDRLERIWFFHHPGGTRAEMEDEYANVMICDANRLSEQDFADLVAEFEMEKGVKPRVAMVDYLGYYARGFKGSSMYEKVSDAVMQLKAEAKSHKLTVIAPHQVNRGVKVGEPITIDDARDSGVIEETGDFVLSIWRTDEGKQEALTQPSGKLRLSLLKSRNGGQGLAFTLQMDLLTLAIVDDHGPLAREAANHCYLLWRGHTYEDLRRQQTTPKQVALGGL